MTLPVLAPDRPVWVKANPRPHTPSTAITTVFVVMASIGYRTSRRWHSGSMCLSASSTLGSWRSDTPSTSMEDRQVEPPPTGTSPRRCRRFVHGSKAPAGKPPDGPTGILVLGGEHRSGRLRGPPRARGQARSLSVNTVRYDGGDMRASGVFGLPVADTLSSAG